MYLIIVKTIEERILKFKVLEYQIKDGHVIFIDSISGLLKRFSVDRVDIEEVKV